MKKTFLLILAMIFSFTMLTFAEETKSGTCGENLTWEIDASGKVLTISGNGDMKNYSNSNNLTPWKNESENIEKIIISNGVTSIGDSSFVWFTNLKDVEIGDDVVSFGKYAFGWCENLENITINSRAEKIDDYAFTWCKNLSSINIANVSSISTSAFSWCEALKTINLNEENTAFSSVDSVLLDKDQTKIVLYPIGKTDKNYVTPSSVKVIGPSAFLYSKLENITLPNVENIETKAFFGSDELLEINFGTSLKTIGSNAFYGCQSLTSVVLPNGLNTLESEAFNKCNEIIDVKIPKTVTKIGENCFTSDNLIIYCFDNSYAVNYANQNGYKYFITADVYLNGNEVKFDQRPAMVNDRTLVPVRAICEAMNMEVVWDETTNTATITKGNNKVEIQVDNKEYTKNGRKLVADVPAMVINDRILLPIRAVSEAFDVTVDWDGENNRVVLTE